MFDNVVQTHILLNTSRVTMKFHFHQIVGIGVALLMVGCSSESETQIRPTGYQVIHIFADENEWRGTIHDNIEDARSEAEEYARKHKVQPGEIVIQYIYPGMDTSGSKPSNHLARRKLEKPITLQALVGQWTMIDTSQMENTRYQIEVFPDGTCKTDFGVQLVEGQPATPDVIQIVHESLFAIGREEGESHIFAVHRFDGDSMDTFLNGGEEQPMQLVREKKSESGSSETKQ